MRWFSRMLAGSWLLACSSAPDEPVKSEPIAEDDAAAAYAAAACEMIERCGCLLGPVKWTDCEPDLHEHFAIWQANARRDGLVFDAACLSEQLDPLATDACRSATACNIYYGDLPVGAPCQRYDYSGAMSSCAQGLRCDYVFGVCMKSPADLSGARLAANEPCVDEVGAPIEFCDYTVGLFCDVDAEAPSCVPLAPASEACTLDVGCETYLCEAGSCVARKPDGDVCARREECESFSCDDGRCGARLEIPNGCTSKIP